jgi:hypothetical protein
MAIGLGFGVRMLSISATNQAVNRPSAVLFQYLIPLLTCVTMIGMIFWNARPRAGRRSRTAAGPATSPAAPSLALARST